MIESRINKHFIQNLYICSICGGCGSGRGRGPGLGGAFPTILSILQFWLEKK